MERLVLFDLDDTLVDRAAGFTVWARRFTAAHALEEAEVTWLEHLDNDGLRPRVELFEKVRERFSLRESAADLVSAYRDDYPRCVPPLSEETRTALRDFRAAGWKIGIATNGAPSQETKIVNAGLDELVDGWVISEVAGAKKPESTIFEAAAHACGCALAGGWMVGDSAEADIAGAIASGLSSVWITRGREWTQRTYQPTLVADSVGQAAAEIISRADEG